MKLRLFSLNNNLFLLFDDLCSVYFFYSNNHVLQSVLLKQPCFAIGSVFTFRLETRIFNYQKRTLGPTLPVENFKPRFPLERLFPTGTVDSRVRIFLPPLNTNDGFYLSICLERQVGENILFNYARSLILTIYQVRDDCQTRYYCSFEQ